MIQLDIWNVVGLIYSVFQIFNSQNNLQITRYACVLIHIFFMEFNKPTSLVGQLVKNPLVVQDPLEKGTASHSSILVWRIPWTVQSMGLHRAGHDWAIFTDASRSVLTNSLLKIEPFIKRKDLIQKKFYYLYVLKLSFIQSMQLRIFNLYIPSKIFILQLNTYCQHPFGKHIAILIY